MSGKKTPKNPKRGKKPASPRQRKYVAGRVAGKTKEQSKRDAGYARTTKGKDIEEKPAVQSMFVTLLEKAGVSDELLATRIHEGLSAMETKTASFEGRITDWEDFIAYSERRAMVELTLKLKGHLIDKHEHRVVRTLEEILEGSHE